MNLFVHLILRLTAVILLCLAATVGWVVTDAHRAVRADTEASADRAAQALQTLYWRELLWNASLDRENLLPAPEWRSLDTLRVVAPGVCITFVAQTEDNGHLCSQVEGIGRPAPHWFVQAYNTIFGPDQPIRRPLSVRQRQAGTIIAIPDPQTAIRQAWSQVSVVISAAALMAAGIGFLAALIICQALLPARSIVIGLRRLEAGDFRHRLPDWRTTEFGVIGRAVNDLSGRLARSMAERTALTNRLFQVQEEERCALARDLHDEFGQCLSATGALAAAIEARAKSQLPALAEDARSISGITRRMMGTLRGTLERLRSQDVDELGLEGSLMQLASGWNARSTAKVAFHLDVAGDLADVPATIALNVYRIAQECLTNAVRHGKPREVRLHIERINDNGGTVTLSVEDDGGGDLARSNANPGYGILGMRERIGALGGSFSMGQTGRGVRVVARIPLSSPPNETAWAA